MIRAHLFCCKNNLHTLFCRKNYLHTFFCHKKEFTHLFFVAKTIYALFCRENDLRAFLSRKQFTHFVWKVFAHWKLPSGKFRLFGPLVIHSFYNLPYFYLDGISSKIPWTLNNIKTRILNWKYTRLCEAFWIPSQSIYTERYFGNLNFPEADKRKVFIFKHYNLYWIWRVGVIRQTSIC